MINIDIWKIDEKEEEYDITKYYNKKSWERFDKETFFSDVIKELDKSFGYKGKNPLERIKILIDQYNKLIKSYQELNNYFNKSNEE
jgi:hypothetical protein